VAKVLRNEYRQGGSLITKKTPDGIEFPDITMERGQTRDVGLFDWFKDVAESLKGAGNTIPDFERNIDIIQIDRNQEIVHRWTVYKAYPILFEGGDWDADREENVIEKVVLSLEYWDKTFGLEQFLPTGFRP